MLNNLFFFSSTIVVIFALVIFLTDTDFSILNRAVAQISVNAGNDDTISPGETIELRGEIENSNALAAKRWTLDSCDPPSAHGCTVGVKAQQGGGWSQVLTYEFTAPDVDEETTYNFEFFGKTLPNGEEDTDTVRITVEPTEGPDTNGTIIEIFPLSNMLLIIIIIIAIAGAVVGFILFRRRSRSGVAYSEPPN